MLPREGDTFLNITYVADVTYAKTTVTSTELAYHAGWCNFRLLRQPARVFATGHSGKRIEWTDGWTGGRMYVYVCYVHAFAVPFARAAWKPACNLIREGESNPNDARTRAAHRPEHAYADLRRFEDQPCYRRPVQRP